MEGKCVPTYVFGACTWAARAFGGSLPLKALPLPLLSAAGDSSASGLTAILLDCSVSVLLFSVVASAAVELLPNTEVVGPEHHTGRTVAPDFDANAEPKPELEPANAVNADEGLYYDTRVRDGRSIEARGLTKGIANDDGSGGGGVGEDVGGGADKAGGTAVTGTSVDAAIGVGESTGVGAAGGATSARGGYAMMSIR